jgi:hypothetical protein
MHVFEVKMISFWKYFRGTILIASNTPGFMPLLACHALSIHG